MKTYLRKYRYPLLLIVLLIAGWFIFRAVRVDASMQKVKSLQQAIAAAAPQERAEKMKEFREAVEQLSPEQRRALFEEGRKKREAEMERYFTLSKEEKKKYLDRDIDRMEQFRKQMQSGNNTALASRGPPQGAGRANSSPEDRERRRKQMLDNTTPEQRAHRDQFRKDMEDRRRQRGLGPNPWGPR